MESLTTPWGVVRLSNMKAKELVRSRIVYSASVFAELILWELPRAQSGTTHHFKYRLAFVVNGKCLIRYDNEAGKGDHRHVGGKEHRYEFTTPKQLVADFERDIERWIDENSDS